MLKDVDKLVKKGFTVNYYLLDNFFVNFVTNNYNYLLNY